MTTDVALTSDELTALAGASAPRWYAVYDTASGANVVATARVNGAPTYPLTTLTVDGTSAGWNNVAKDMTIFIGSSAGAFDRGVYRVRKAGTGTTLNPMAIGENDAGSITMVDRSVPIQDNDYITVLYRFDIFGVFPRIDYLGVGLEATIYEDYDAAYSNFNRYPPPIINVTIDGQYGQYATHVYSATSKTFNIVMDITLWATSSSATFAITLPTGITLNSGSLTGSGTTNTINVTAAHSADSYTIKFVATENNGNSWTAYRKVWIKSDTYPPISFQWDGGEDSTTGSTRSIRLNSLTSFPAGAMWHLFDMGTWNGTDVPSAIKAFTGYIVRQREDTDVGLKSVTLDLVGPAGILERIGGQSQIMSSTASPANWQQHYSTLSYLDFIIWWLMVRRTSGLLQMFNCTLFGFTTSQKQMTDWRIDTGTLLDQLQSLAKRAPGGNFGCDPSGEVMLRRWPNRIPSADRSGIETRISISTNRYTKANLGREARPQVRRLRGEAFYSDGSTNTPVWVDAPSLPGQGQSEEKADRLIVDSVDELLTLTGDEYAARNNPYPDGSIVIQKNYAVFRPAQMLRNYLTITSGLRYDSVIWQNYIMIKRVSYAFNPDSTIDTTVYFEAETAGSDGTFVPIPVADPSTYNSPYQFTPFSPIPFWQRANTNPAGTSAGASTVPKNGSVAFCGTATAAYIATNFLGTPIYKNVTPSGLSSFQIKHGMVEIGGKKAWLLTSDGTDSKVYYTPNVFASSVVWTAGATVTGVYTLVRITNAAGGIMIYTPGDPITSVSPTYNAGGSGPATINVGATFTLTLSTSGPTGCFSPYYNGQISFSECVTLELISFGSLNADNCGLTQAVQGWTPCGGSTQFDATVPYADKITNVSISDFGLNSTAPGSVTLKLLSIDSAAGSAKVRYSSTNGSSWGSELTIGTTPGAIGGFDIQRTGTVSIAATAGKTRKATTLGGAYSDDQSWDSNPKLVEIPWGTRNSTTSNNTGSSPQYIVGLSAADGSGETFYWIVSGTPTAISPKIGGVAGIPVSADCLVSWQGKYLDVLASFSGTTHLMTSTDGGANWLDRGAVNATALRLRRLAHTPGQLYAAGVALEYSNTNGASLVSKTKPSSSDLIWFEPVG